MNAVGLRRCFEQLGFLCVFFKRSFFDVDHLKSLLEFVKILLPFYVLDFSL